MKVVDARLQRDGEVDEVVLATAEQDQLRPADAAQRQIVGERDEERDDGRNGGAERDPAGDRGAQVHRTQATAA